MKTTRRKALQGIGAIASSGLILPRAHGLIWRGGSSAASPALPFDFYASTTGTGTASAGGTLANPWPISMLSNATAQARYAGKRVGLLPGTYDVSGLMGTNESVSALTLIGGTGLSNQTYIGSSDSSGNYSRGTATLDAKGSTGFYGGANANQSPIMAARSGCNFWTVDGIKFIGFSMWAFHVGNSPGGSSAPTNWTIQNCEFTGGNCQFATGTSGVNCGILIVYCVQNGLFTNNWCHDNVGSTDTQHWSCVYQWSLASTDKSFNMQYTFNTIVKSGNLHGKEGGGTGGPNQFNHTIAYNYIDMTGTLATSEYCGSAIEGWMSTGADVAATLTSWHHNIIRANGMALSFDNDNPSHSFVNYPLAVYSNTVEVVGQQVDGYLNGGYSSAGVNGGLAGQVSFYNNLYYDNGFGTGTYGYWLTNVDTFALLDYNVYGSLNKFNTLPSGANTSAGLTARNSLALWAGALTPAGFEAHSATNATDPFAGGAIPSPSFYQLNGSVGTTAGRVGGTSGGAVCPVGAWDGTVTQIGCNFAVYT